MSPWLVDSVGWGATAVFTLSFLFADATRLRAVQILGALLWLVYGMLIDSSPVIVANLLVCVVACWTTVRYIARRRSAAAAPENTEPNW
jgi:Bacterial inner membrane protein